MMRIKGSARCRCILLSLAFFTLVITPASPQRFAFEQITTLDGLPENYINCVFQDRDGFMWFGTHDGLCRYDGIEFRNLNIRKNEDHWIQSILIRHISGDREGNLWILTADKGLYRYDPSMNRFWHIQNPLISSSLQPDELVTTYRVGNDLLVGTDSGLCILQFNSEEDETGTCTRWDEIPNVYQIYGIESEMYSTAWLGSRNGLYKYQIDRDGSKILKHYSKPGNSEIQYVTGFREGLLVASPDGIFYFKEGAGFSRVSSFVATVLLVDREEKLWASGGSGLTIMELHDSTKIGFNILERVREGWQMENISSRLVTELYMDHTGNIWIGTQNGVNRYNPNRKLFGHIRASLQKGSLASNSMRAVYEDSHGNIWIGTNGKGLHFLNAGSARQKEYNNFLSLSVNEMGSVHDAYCIEQVEWDGESRFMVGTSPPEAVAFYRLENGLPVKCPPLFDPGVINWSVFDIVDDNDLIWIGSIFDGLYRVRKETGEIRHFSQSDGHTISSNIVRDILVDNDDNLWIATGRGINYLPASEKEDSNPVFGTFQHFPGDTTSLSHHYILTLFQSSNGTIWVGTMGGGLCRYGGNGRFFTIDDEDGLPNNVIKGIEEDFDGNLWISSNRGLTRFNPETGDISNFDLYDGLQDFEFNDHACARLSDGEMIFGGNRGLTIFYPHEIGKEETYPEIALTDLHVLNQPIRVGQQLNGRVVLDRVINETSKIRLKHSENSFSISFAGLHYSAPMKIKYRYMLEGVNRDWIQTAARDNVAKYTSLRPGNYTFKVMASNNDGVWNPTPKSIDIKVIPPFWYAWPSIFIYAIVFISLLFFFRKYTFIRIKEKHDLQLEQFEQDKIRELSQMKLRFYTNISHEFRTPITLIIGPVKRLMQQYNTLSPAKSKQMLQTIHRNSSLLLRLINQLMDFRKLEQDKMVLNATECNLYLTAKEIYESFRELAYQKQIEYTFWSHAKEIPLWYEYEKIEKILYNLLSNAFKYTPERGSIHFTIHDYDDEFVEMRIEDTGIGISESARQNVFQRFYRSKNLIDHEVGSTGIGLSLSKGLVDLHKGIIDFESIPGSGSTFYVRLRKGDHHLSEKEKDLEQPAIYRQLADMDQILQTRPGPQASVPPVNESGNKILIVEDNNDLRLFLKECYESEWQVFTAEDGITALDSIFAYHPDIVLSDVMMPHMDGLELCRRIKEDEHTSHIPVILLSARNTEEAQIEGYNLGADAYVSKPFDAAILLAQTKAILKQQEDSRRRFRDNIDISPSEVAMTAMDEKFLQRSCKLVEENITDSQYSVSKLASEYGMSQKLMNRKLKVLTGLTAKSFIRSIKMKRAAQLLRTGRYTVSEVTYDVGFSDLKYFRSCFKEEFGETPSEYKKMHVSEEEEVLD